METKGDKKAMLAEAYVKVLADLGKVLDLVQGLADAAVGLERSMKQVYYMGADAIEGTSDVLRKDLN